MSSLLSYSSYGLRCSLVKFLMYFFSLRFVWYLSSMYWILGHWMNLQMLFCNSYSHMICSILFVQHLEISHWLDFTFTNLLFCVSNLLLKFHWRNFSHSRWLTWFSLRIYFSIQFSFNNLFCPSFLYFQALFCKLQSLYYIFWEHVTFLFVCWTMRIKES